VIPVIDIQDEPPESDFGDDVVALPIDGMLDLHAFRPREVKHLVEDYLQACRERGIVEVRIVHGKGTGTLRRTVHGLLDQLDWVVEYHLAGPGAGGWGATIVTIEPLRTEPGRSQ